MSFINNLLLRLKKILIVKAAETPDGEVPDPIIALREKCAAHTECRKYKKRYEVCNIRVNSTPGTEETCEEELFDFLHHRDKCVANDLFKLLK